MLPVYFHSDRYQVQPEFDQAFDRMQKMRRGTIEGQLIEIRNFLHQHSNLQDPLTVSIRKWYEKFSGFVRSPASIDQTEKGYIEILQQLLIDPLTQTPLDVEAHLGSDGYTYANYSLCLYLNAVPNEHQDRSPVNHPIDEPFHTIPHPVARFLVEWLIKFDHYPHSPRLDIVQRAFLDLQAQGCIPLIPTRENQKRRALMQAQIDRRKRRQAQVQAEIDAKAKAQLEAQAQALIQQQEQVKRQAQADAEFLFAQVIQLDKEQFEAIQQKVDQVFGAIDQHAQEAAMNQLRRIEAMDQQDQKKLQHLQQEIKDSEDKIEDLKKQNQELKNELENLEHSLKEAERANLQLQISLNEAKQEIEARNSSALSGILTGIAIIGIAALTTWATGGVGTVAATPSSAKAVLVFAL